MLSEVVLGECFENLTLKDTDFVGYDAVTLD